MKKPELETVTAKFESVEFTSNNDETKRLIIKTNEENVTLTEKQTHQLRQFMSSAEHLNNDYYD